MNVNYVVADPTKNITVLVTDPVSKEERSLVTKAMFESVPDCEQVGYVRSDAKPMVRLEMMGGEFCGNASLAAAAYYVQSHGIDVTKAPFTVVMECSGFDKAFECETRAGGMNGGGASTNHYIGTLAMPAPEKIEYCDSHPIVFLPGIAHMIMPADRFTRKQVENNIRDYASRYDVEAFGILLWDDERKFMKPCVYVKGSDTIVWENGCATGSTCVGWYRYVEFGEASTDVAQPGGSIRIQVRDNIPFLTGNVMLR